MSDLAEIRNSLIRRFEPSDTPFYYEESTATLNFGNGFNITGNWGEAGNWPKTAMEAVGIPVGSSDAASVVRWQAVVAIQAKVDAIKQINKEISNLKGKDGVYNDADGATSHVMTWLESRRGVLVAEIQGRTTALNDSFSQSFSSTNGQWREKADSVTNYYFDNTSLISNLRKTDAYRGWDDYTRAAAEVAQYQGFKLKQNRGQETKSGSRNKIGVKTKSGSAKQNRGQSPILTYQPPKAGRSA